MKTIKTLTLLAFLLVGIAFFVQGDVAMAQTAQQVQDGVNSIGGGDSASFEGTLSLLVDVFFYIIGALAVIMIIYSGFRYITSGGDASAVSSAKSTLLYSVIGLVIAMSAYAIANFVIGAFEGDPDPFECGSSIDPGCEPSQNG